MIEIESLIPVPESALTEAAQLDLQRWLAECGADRMLLEAEKLALEFWRHLRKQHAPTARECRDRVRRLRIATIGALRSEPPANARQYRGEVEAPTPRLRLIRRLSLIRAWLAMDVLRAELESQDFWLRNCINSALQTMPAASLGSLQDLAQTLEGFGKALRLQDALETVMFKQLPPQMQRLADGWIKDNKMRTATP